MTRNAPLFAVGFALLAAAVETQSARADEAVATKDAPGDERATSPSTRPMGAGVSLGYEDGLWGGKAWGQGLRVKIPFQAQWGLAIRPMIFMQTPLEWAVSDAPVAWRTDLGGRIEVYGAAPGLWNVARMYASGGPQV